MLVSMVFGLCIAACGFIDDRGGTSSLDAVEAVDTADVGLDTTGTSTELVETAANSRADVSTGSKPSSSNGLVSPATSRPVTPTTTTPATASATPAATSTTTVTSKINSIQEIENDMALKNEGALLNLDPAKFAWAGGPGIVMMGNDPRGTNTPSWFQPSDTSLKNSSYWNVLLPWFVLFEGVGNAASNTRVHIRNFKLYYKSRKDRQWRLLGADNDFGGFTCVQDSNYAGCSGALPNKRSEAEGGVSFRPVPFYNFHGWWTKGFVTIQPDDIAALFVTGQMRLVRDSTSVADDRGKAKYLIHVGADYYPTATYSFGSTANPGAGVSRSKYVTSNWRAISMLTYRDIGTQWPGGGISRDEGRAAPPPMD
jgi:hypothetical protein